MKFFPTLFALLMALSVLPMEVFGEPEETEKEWWEQRIPKPDGSGSWKPDLQYPHLPLCDSDASWKCSMYKKEVDRFKEAAMNMMSGCTFWKVKFTPGTFPHSIEYGDEGAIINAYGLEGFDAEDSNKEIFCFTDVGKRLPKLRERIFGPIDTSEGAPEPAPMSISVTASITPVSRQDIGISKAILYEVSVFKLEPGKEGVKRIVIRFFKSVRKNTVFYDVSYRIPSGYFKLGRLSVGGGSSRNPTAHGSVERGGSAPFTLATLFLLKEVTTRVTSMVGDRRKANSSK